MFFKKLVKSLKLAQISKLKFFKNSITHKNCLNI